MTIYSTGLRVSEALNLVITDIDSNRAVIRVRQGKGHKDRYVPLFPSLLVALRDYWRVYTPPKPFLFPGEDVDGPLTKSAIERVCSATTRKLKLVKARDPAHAQAQLPIS